MKLSFGVSEYLIDESVESIVPDHDDDATSANLSKPKSGMILLLVIVAIIAIMMVVFLIPKKAVSAVYGAGIGKQYRQPSSSGIGPGRTYRS